jgi:phosphoenolpyruvate carboxykinase (ATP)
LFAKKMAEELKVEQKKLFEVDGKQLTTGQMFRDKVNNAISIKTTPRLGAVPNSKLVMPPPLPVLCDDDHHTVVHDYGITVDRIFHNPSVPVLYEAALRYEASEITSTGALSTRSGVKTGRSPKDKRVVKDSLTEADVWWGNVNIPLKEKSFMINRERAVDYLNTRSRLYVVDGFAGWHKESRIPIRVVTELAYHALFMRNMLVRPTDEELLNFEPGFTIYNAGKFPCNRFTDGMSSVTSVSINFSRKEFVILGTEYAGEMKKGVFTVMHYLMPKKGILTLHSSVNVGPKDDVCIFFGLSGTGKTTLSADPNRRLIGDDEHCWGDDGVWNIEGGCYAKAIGLTEEQEPQIYNAIRYGTVLENVVLDKYSREVDFHDISLTENTRAAYPIEFISNAMIPCRTENHPTNVILLCCDAFGVLPPVSKLSFSQTEYHFISGYTAKVAGTEQGIVEPEATFSACFGDAFLALHPITYAKMLSERMAKHHTEAYLVNTGWIGGAYGVGKRCPLKFSRAIVTAIQAGQLKDVATETMPVFGFEVPKEVPGVPSEMLNPRDAWADKAAYDETVRKLGGMFQKNFVKFADQCPADTINAGPKL